jgi:hypothetical protein
VLWCGVWQRVVGFLPLSASLGVSFHCSSHRCFFPGEKENQDDESYIGRDSGIKGNPADRY